MDTQGAISALARMLRCKPAVFAFAGTKDKRAVTVQCVTAHRVRPERMAQLNRGLPGRLRVGDFRPAQRWEEAWACLPHC